MNILSDLSGALSRSYARRQFSPNHITSGGGLEEIVVPLTPSANLPNVPRGYRDFNPPIASTGINTSQDLAASRPGLGPQAAVYIHPPHPLVRHTSNGPGVDIPVATYIEGVYLATALPLRS